MKIPKQLNEALTKCHRSIAQLANERDEARRERDELREAARALVGEHAWCDNCCNPATLVEGLDPYNEPAYCDHCAETEYSDSDAVKLNETPYKTALRRLRALLEVSR